MNNDNVVKERRANPWCKFVKENSKNICIDNVKPKERFAILSEMWKNRKASMITISSDYLTEITYNCQTLKLKLQEAERTIKQLEERIEYLESNYEHEHNIDI